MNTFKTQFMANIALMATLAVQMGARQTTPFQLHQGDGSGLKEIVEATKAALTEANAENLKQLKAHQETTDKALDEIKKLGTITTETNAALTKSGEDAKAMGARLLDLEQKLAKRGAGADDGPETKTIGQRVVESEEYKTASKSGVPNMAAVEIGSFHKAVINATGQNQPLVPVQRAPMVQPTERPLTIRDLLPVGRASGNLIEYVKELVFTNNAAVVYDSPNYENVTKPESNLTFQLATAAVATIAHWIAASRQVLSDADMLRGYIEHRLTYGLKYVEDDQLLNGTGAAGQLSGLMTNATAYAGSGAVSTDQQLDTLLRAITQVRTGGLLEADGIVINPIDWMKIRLVKDTQGRYIFGDPNANQTPSIWGKRVVASDAIASTRFLVGSFQMGAQLWDREDATVRIAEQHADFFVKNMVAILAEERIALTVYRSTAFVRGNFL